MTEPWGITAIKASVPVKEKFGDKVLMTGFFRF